MSGSLFRRCSFILFLCISSFVTAQETRPLTASCNRTCEACSPCCPPVQCPYGVYLSGSFIYWQPIQENMKLGVVTDSSNPLDLVHGREVDLDFDYEPGFKVGLGFHLDYDDWDTFIEYTRFRAKESTSKNLDPSNINVYILPSWQFPSFLNPQYHSATEKWTLDMDFIDWDLTKNYCFGSHLTFRPFFGIRGAWIDQKVDVKYKNTNTSFAFIWPSTRVRHTSSSWGVGPRFGFSTKWSFCNDFRIYADQELDLLFTRYDLKAKQTSDVTVANRYIIKQNNADFLRTHLDLRIGLGWGTCFGCDAYRFDISADYGFQVFFDQNPFRNTFNDQAVGKSYMPNGNLYIHGLTATLRFDF